MDENKALKEVSAGSALIIGPARSEMGTIEALIGYGQYLRPNESHYAYNLVQAIEKAQSVQKARKHIGLVAAIDGAMDLDQIDTNVKRIQKILAFFHMAATADPSTLDENMMRHMAINLAKVAEADKKARSKGVSRMLRHVGYRGPILAFLSPQDEDTPASIEFLMRYGGVSGVLKGGRSIERMKQRVAASLHRHHSLPMVARNGIIGPAISDEDIQTEIKAVADSERGRRSLLTLLTGNRDLAHRVLDGRGGRHDDIKRVSFRQVLSLLVDQGQLQKNQIGNIEILENGGFALGDGSVITKRSLIKTYGTDWVTEVQLARGIAQGLFQPERDTSAVFAEPANDSTQIHAAM